MSSRISWDSDIREQLARMARRSTGGALRAWLDAAGVDVGDLVAVVDAVEAMPRSLLASVTSSQELHQAHADAVDSYLSAEARCRAEVERCREALERAENELQQAADRTLELRQYEPREALQVDAQCA